MQGKNVYVENIYYLEKKKLSPQLKYKLRFFWRLISVCNERFSFIHFFPMDRSNLANGVSTKIKVQEKL